jgi:hypothetical protein
MTLAIAFSVVAALGVVLLIIPLLIPQHGVRDF